MLVAAVKLRNSLPMILNHESEQIYLHQLTRRARDALKGFSSKKYSCEIIKNMWAEERASADGLMEEDVDCFVNIFATKPYGSELLTTFSIDGLSRIAHIFGPNADRCK
ncbi:unnamed protein product [Clavelina lepadiformis]|uniref:Uncharacterized protein n=1 Tax=Clavelina lepadiformis TaxID=159417 RepID=A0ABP0F328_CLALP